MEKRGNKPVLYVLVHGDPHVIQHRQILKKPDILKRSCQPQLADVAGLPTGDHLIRSVPGQGDRTGGGLVNAGEKVKHGSLACAVRPDQTYHFPFVQNHINIGDGRQSAERFGQLFNS